MELKYVNSNGKIYLASNRSSCKPLGGKILIIELKNDSSKFYFQEDTFKALKKEDSS